MTRYLTKSRFKLATECPAKLMYTRRDEYVDTNQDNEMLQGLAEGGFQIGALAQLIYAQEAESGDIAWHEVEGKQQEQIETTNQLLTTPDITLFEPTIIFGNFLVRVDVLRKRGNKVDLIEVKSKSFNSSGSYLLRTEKGALHRDFIPYLQDIAFQTMVVRNAHPEWEVSSYLMMPDKAKPTSTSGLHRLFPVNYSGTEKNKHTSVVMPDPKSKPDIDHQFMQPLNVDQEVNEILNTLLKTKAPCPEGTLELLAEQWADIYASSSEVEPPIASSNCSNCEFYNPEPKGSKRSGFHECWERTVTDWKPEYTREQTILGLYNDNKRLKGKFIDQERYFLDEITTDDLGVTPIDGPLTNAQRQWMQVSGTWLGKKGFYFDQEGFEAERENWVYPYYFLDFEGARCALPFRPGQRPNAMNAFQYSLHIMHGDGRVEHVDQFLDLSQEGDPHSRLLRQLKKALGDSGTVFRWHTYENMLLNELRTELLNRINPEPDKDELVEFIETLTFRKENKKIAHRGEREMVDQAELAAKYYFHPYTRGSSSIKKVLPAVMSSSKFLKETYSQPIYGGNGSLSSLNYKDNAVTWWKKDSENTEMAIDPYRLLPATIKRSNEIDLYNASVSAATSNESTILKDGSGAMMGYIRLQSGVIAEEDAIALKDAMYRYCELDTLAMVMVMQSWIHCKVEYREGN